MHDESDNENSIFSLQGLRDIRKRPDILSRIRWEVTPQVVMEPRFLSRPEDVGRLRQISGYVFYIETESDQPALMLLKVGKSDVATTAGKIDEIPSELLRRAIEHPVHPPVSGMFAITEEIRKWLEKELSL